MPPLVIGSVHRHVWALRTASQVTQWWRNLYCRKAVRVSPRGVIRTLNLVGIRPVLIGTYGLDGWRDDPRATQDVDVLVRRNQVRRAVEALSERYPRLRAEKRPTVVWFFDQATKHEVLDVHKPVYPLTRELFRTAIKIGATHDIPTLEMTIVSKLNLLASADRRLCDRLQDLADLMDIIGFNRTILDLARLRVLMKEGISRRNSDLRNLVDDVLADADVSFTRYAYRETAKSK